MSWMILQGDARRIPLRDESVQMVCSSPPYWGLRDYGIAGQLGPERTPEEYVENMVAVFREVRRVLREDGVIWVNLGDSYNAYNGAAGPGSKLSDIQSRECPHLESGYGLRTKGLKPKDLCMIPARVALALQADGWFLRSMIPWLKKNPMPESCQDRPTSAVEYVFLFSKSERYFYDAEAIRKSYLLDSLRTERKTSGQAKRNELGELARTTPVGRTCGVHPSGRNRRNSDWFFESWQGLLSNEESEPLAFIVNPKPLSIAHFASFPPALVVPMIKAGTSEKGCCPAPDCGKPWVRVVEKEKGTPASFNGSSFNAGKTLLAREPLAAVGQGERTLATTTLGWRPSCSHDLPPVPCLVFDPFSGAGTVPLVADRLGRHGVGLELSAEYCRMAYGRTFNDAPLLTAITQRSPAQEQSSLLFPE